MSNVITSKTSPRFKATEDAIAVVERVLQNKEKLLQIAQEDAAVWQRDVDQLRGYLETLREARLLMMEEEI